MAQPKQAESEWITKEEAAEILNVNVRQVQKRAEQGYIEKRLLPRLPNERQARVVYARRDVNALAAGTPNQHGTMEPENPSKIAQAREERRELAVVPKGQVDPWQALAARLVGLSELAAKYPPPAKNPWLTLDEAAGFSGLTKAWLLKEAETGEGSIATRDMGKGARGGRWRFFRGDLERSE